MLELCGWWLMMVSCAGVSVGPQILKRDKAWNSGAASQLILKIIEALGPGHPLGKKARSRMTNLLFL